MTVPAGDARPAELAGVQLLFVLATTLDTSYVLGAIARTLGQPAVLAALAS